VVRFVGEAALNLLHRLLNEAPPAQDRGVERIRPGAAVIAGDQPPADDVRFDEPTRPIQLMGNLPGLVDDSRWDGEELTNRDPLQKRGRV